MSPWGLGDARRGVSFVFVCAVCCFSGFFFCFFLVVCVCGCLFLVSGNGRALLEDINTKDMFFSGRPVALAT